MMRWLWAALAAMFVCATSASADYYYIPTFVYVAPPTPTADPGSYDTIKKVAVLSVLGAKFTVLGSKELKGFDFASWQIDLKVNDLLKKYLGGRFEFTDMQADAKAFQALPRSYFREAKTLAYLKTLPNPGVDAYIIVRPCDGELPGPDGIGLEPVRDFRNPGKVAVWTNFEIDIIDAHKLRYIAKAYSRIQTKDDQPPLYAAKIVDEIDLNSWLGGLNRQHLDAIRRNIDELLPEAMVETLRALKLGVPLPPIGSHDISKPANAVATTGLRRLAVVSAIGDVFHMVTPGNAFVDTINYSFDSRDWGIDPAAEAMAREVLAKHYEVKTAEPADRALLEHALLVSGQSIPSISGLARSSEIDAYVVILKARADRFMWLFEGAGMAKWLAIHKPDPSVYAAYGIVVVDARTLEPIAGMAAVRAVKEACTQPVDSGIEFPECAVSGKLWADTPAKITPDAKQQFRTLLLAALSSSIPETLFQLGLDPVAEPVAAK